MILTLHANKKLNAQQKIKRRQKNDYFFWLVFNLSMYLKSVKKCFVLWHFKKKVTKTKIKNFTLVFSFIEPDGPTLNNLLIYHIYSRNFLFQTCRNVQIKNSDKVILLKYQIQVISVFLYNVHFSIFLSGKIISILRLTWTRILLNQWFLIKPYFCYMAFILSHGHMEYSKVTLARLNLKSETRG